jgi:hypothetical protein
MSAGSFVRALPRRRGAVAVLFLVWAIWLAFPYFGFGSGSYVRIYDNADSTLAARAALRTTDPSHLGTAWNPQPLAGVDQTPVTSYADLDGWLFAVLPGWLAYGLVMLAQRFLAGYFTYRLLRDRLKVGWPASLCAGLVYALFSQSTVNEAWAGFTLYDGLYLALLPAIFWALDDAAGWTFRRRLLIGAGLGLLLGFTSTYALAVFVLPVVAVWLLVRRRAPWLQTLSVLAVFFGGWIVAEAPALWSSLLNADQSQRAARTVHDLSVRTAVSQKVHFVSSCVADNQVMVEAAVLALLAVRFRSRAIIAALAAAAAIFAVVLVSGLSETGLRAYLGPLAGFELDRIYTIAPFVLILAGALGLDVFAALLRDGASELRATRRSLWAVAVTLAVLVALAPSAGLRVWTLIRDEMSAGATYAGVYERPQLRHLAAATRADPPFRVATVYAPQAFSPPAGSTWPELFGQLPAFAWPYGLETADGYVVLFSARYQRFWSSVTAPALEADPAMRQKFWLWGNRVYLFVPSDASTLEERPGQSIAAVTDVRSFCDLDLLSLDNVRYLISPVRLSGPGLTLVSASGGAPWPLYVYENVEAAPRFFVVGSVRTFSSDSDLLRAMGDASLETLRSVGFLEAGDAHGFPESPAAFSGSATALQYAADDATIAVKADRRCFLIATMNYGQYWQATVDGRPVATVPVYSAFIGVPVPAGAHQVELRYQPPYAWLLGS